MKNLSLNAKFSFILSIFVTASLIVSILGILKMAELNNSITAIIQGNVPRIMEAKNLNIITNAIKNEEKLLVIELTDEGMTQIIARIEKLDASATKTLEDLKKVIRVEENRIAAEAAGKHLEEWRGIHTNLKRLALANKNTEAAALARGASNDVLNKLDEAMQGIAERNVKALEVEDVRTNELYDASRLILISVSAIAILSGLILAFFMLRAISSSMDRIIAALKDSSGQVTSASQQIAASSQQLSQGATEQASSLEETSSAIEEMNSMVQKNAESAEQSLSTSDRSGESANRGKKVVDDMKKAMVDIDAANVNIMNQTNESNVKISEIIKVISEIGNKTKVINDIVFQTKLLSFNASVEAARAGEHGKGFAVVAEEVGNLAQMSGNAAKEISGLLDSSIEKVESIVRDTKSSVEKLIAESKAKVDVGTRVASDCGAVLEEIVSNVGLVSQMSQSISTATSEQARGISEITKAVGQLDQMTQQNAAVSEEAASAAEELAAQAKSMQDVVHDLISTIRGGNAAVTIPVQVVSPRPAMNRAKTSQSRSQTGKVLHITGKEKKVSIPPQPDFRMVSGGDILPSENDPRFKDI